MYFTEDPSVFFKVWAGLGGTKNFSSCLPVADKMPGLGYEQV